METTRIFNQKTSRFFYLDAARAFFICLGIVYHVSFAYSDKEWLVNSSLYSRDYRFILDFTTLFRMEGFFLISGFFSMMAIERKSVKQFLVDRIKRLGVPLLFCGLVLNSLVFIAVGGVQQMTDNKLLTSYFLGGQWLMHLWFLGDLLVMVFFFSIVLWVWPGFKAKLKGLNMPVILFIIGLVAFVLLCKRIGWRIPDPPYGNSWLFLTKNRFFRYLPFYFSGIVLFQNKLLLFRFVRYKYLNLLIAIICFGGLIMTRNEYSVEILENFLSIALIGLILFAFSKWFDYHNALIRSVSDASYTIYLIHQPLIIFTVLVVNNTLIPLFLQWLIMNVFVFVISYYFHNLVVQNWPVALFLFNGKQVSKISRLRKLVLRRNAA